MSGNVVPEKGPTMEQVYDGMQATHSEPETDPIKTASHNLTTFHAENNSFHKLPNPELTMYVFPHLAGNDEMPIPGYFTEFNAYTQDHYALPIETIRE